MLHVTLQWMQTLAVDISQVLDDDFFIDRLLLLLLPVSNFLTSFYSAPLRRRCTRYGNSVCLSVRPSHAGSVKTTARSTVQFALLDSKMCLVL